MGHASVDWWSIREKEKFSYKNFECQKWWCICVRSRIIRWTTVKMAYGYFSTVLHFNWMKINIIDHVLKISFVTNEHNPNSHKLNWTIQYTFYIIKYTWILDYDNDNDNDGALIRTYQLLLNILNKIWLNLFWYLIDFVLNIFNVINNNVRKNCALSISGNYTKIHTKHFQHQWISYVLW